MPWCPKCRNEYKDGYTVCADCGAQLVDSLENEAAPICFGSKEELTKMCDFMNANGISDTEIRFDEKESIYELFVGRDKVTEAQKQLRVYLSNVAANMKPDAENEEEQEKIAISKQELHKTPYLESDQRAEEYKSGADTLLLVGILGMVVLILLQLGIIPISIAGSSKILVTVVMGALFLIFIILGISSRKSYKKLKEQAGNEKDVKEEIKSYLLEKIVPEEFDAELIVDQPTMEILYFRRNAKMKRVIAEVKPDLDSAFVEYLIEEIYPEIFE